VALTLTPDMVPVLPPTAAAKPPSDGGPLRLAVRRFRANRGAALGLAALLVLVAVSLLAPLLSPYDPVAQPDIVALRSQPPSLAHPFGTDQYSRDVLSRVLYGSRVSLGVATLAVIIATTVGTVYGAVAGFVGGRTDAFMMRAVDALLAIPRVLLLIVVVALWRGVSLPVLVVLLGLTGWFGVSRLVRAQVLALGEREFVTAARALGASGRRVLLRHILPNALTPVIVAATLGVGNAIAIEAGLSYLGLGVQQPLASWGNIIQDGADQVAVHWWISLFPGLAIVLTMMALNAVGDGLRDALDPRQLPGR
jgi:peptide/nickel transport system permease protein